MYCYTASVDVVLVVLKFTQQGRYSNLKYQTSCCIYAFRLFLFNQV